MLSPKTLTHGGLTVNLALNLKSGVLLEGKNANLQLLLATVLSQAEQMRDPRTPVTHQKLAWISPCQITRVRTNDRRFLTGTPLSYTEEIEEIHFPQV